MDPIHPIPCDIVIINKHTDISLMQTPTIKTIILRITLIIALAELIVMLMLGGISHDLSAFREAMLDALVLVGLSTPIIYIWVIKPYVLARDEAVEKITFMAFHDPLTQLPNRRLLSEHLKISLARINRNDISGALLLIDMDGFKSINDSSGHDAGDAILIEIANRLQSCLRGEDIACRLGGDEFIVLLSELNFDKEIAQQQVMQIATRIQNAIVQPIELHKTFQLGASIGIRMLGEEKTTVERVIKEADVAMYRAKQAGRGGIIVFE